MLLISYVWFSNVVFVWIVCTQCAPSTKIFGMSAPSSVLLTSNQNSNLKSNKYLETSSIFFPSPYDFFALKIHFRHKFSNASHLLDLCHRPDLPIQRLIHSQRLIHYECLMFRIIYIFNDSKSIPFLPFSSFLIQISKHKLLNAHHTTAHRAANGVRPRP